MSGSGRTPGGGSGNPLQYSCLGNLMHRGAWPAMGLQRMGYDLVAERQVEMTTQRIAIGKKELRVELCRMSLFRQQLFE